jgi:hypothetical protein
MLHAVVRDLGGDRAVARGAHDDAGQKRLGRLRHSRPIDVAAADVDGSFEGVELRMIVDVPESTARGTRDRRPPREEEIVAGDEERRRPCERDMSDGTTLSSCGEVSTSSHGEIVPDATSKRDTPC